MLGALASVGTPDPEILSALTTGSVTLVPTLLAAGAVAVGVSIAVIGFKKGFAFFRSNIKV